MTKNFCWRRNVYQSGKKIRIFDKVQIRDKYFDWTYYTRTLFCNTIKCFYVFKTIDIFKRNLFLANHQPRSSSLPKHLWNVGPSDERHRQEVNWSEGTVHARLQGRCKKGRQEKVDSSKSKEVR